MDDRNTGIDDIITVIQQHRLGWYGHVLRKDENDWVKKCMGYEVKGVRPRGRKKKTWSEVIEKMIVIPCKYARKMLWTVWRKLIKNVV